MGQREDRDHDRALRHAGRLGGRGGPEAEAHAVVYLQSLSPAEFVRVMQQVFASAAPFSEEQAYCRSKWFLGIAHSYRESEPGEPEAWEPWRVEAAAYHGPDVNYGGPGDLGQSSGGGGTLGACIVCKTLGHRSNLKHGVCPVCGRDTYMT